MAINKVVLMGRLTSDPELKATGNGTAVTSFAIAVDREYQKNKDEKVADFIDCVAWRNTAEFITKYFRKGDMIALTGNLRTDSYTDKNGSKRKRVDVNIESVSFCGGKNNASPDLNITPTTNDFEEIGDDDDLPF